MKHITFLLSIFALGLFALMGCGHSEDTDVTVSSEFGFATFAGTVWKTKVKVAVVQFDDGTYLVAPKAFDPTNALYTPPPSMHVLVILPVGTPVRIDRLMKNNGNWGGLRVIGTVDYSTSTEKSLYIDDIFIAKNEFLCPGDSSSKTWDAAPDMLER